MATAFEGGDLGQVLGNSLSTAGSGALSGGVTGSVMGLGAKAKDFALDKINSAYVDGKLPIPRTNLTPNAGRNARMLEAIENYPIDEPFNYGRVSEDTLAQHNDIQENTGRDFVKNRDVTVYPNAHNKHVKQRIIDEGLSPQEYVSAADSAIYGKDRQLLASKKPVGNGAQNVIYENPTNPSRAILGQFDDGLSLKSVQKLNPDTLSQELKKTTTKRGYTDGANLESPSGLNQNISQNTQNVNSNVKVQDLCNKYWRNLANKNR